MNKTNVIRNLEAKKIPHEIRTYHIDENDFSGTAVADRINAEANVVFKTLVAHGDKTGFVVFCVPVNAELNLKKAASITRNKKVELIPTKELFAVTGYIRGGCSPIGMKKKYPTFIDETAKFYDKIFVSAGVNGIQVGISPKDLELLTDLTYADLK